MSLSLYPIIKELGDGGFGKTYLATNTLLPARPYCVVKQLKPVASDPQLQQLIQDRFKKEAGILEGLGDGSNGMIPRLYAYFVEQGEFYLVQEYVDGQTLNERVRSQGIFTELQVRDLLTNILPTLSYVHSRGIVHRDIKPDNIMLRQRDNKPILIDFGAVKETMSTTVTNSGNSSRSIVIGTPGFMPVEQMAGRPMYASDIYALGLTAIYLLTGKMPAEIETDPNTGNINWQPHALNISPQLLGVLNKATQAFASVRYSNAQEMLDALDNNSKEPQPRTHTQPTPTIVAPVPINSQQSTVYTPLDRQLEVQPTNFNQSNSQNPMVAAIIGVGVGGILIVLGLVLGKHLNDNPNKQPEKVFANNNTRTTDNNTASNNTSNLPNNSTNNTTQVRSTPIDNQPSPTIPQQSSPVSNSSSISRDAALGVVKQWLAYKQVLLAPPYNKSIGSDLLVGKAYRDNVDKSSEPCNSSDSDDCLSSVDWLQKYNAQYSFGVQRIDAVNRFESSGDTGSIFVTVTEYRTLHKTGGRKVPSGGTKQARYDLKYEDGKVKIAEYKVLN